jgi:hypothetical protein
MCWWVFEVFVLNLLLFFFNFVTKEHKGHISCRLIVIVGSSSSYSFSISNGSFSLCIHRSLVLKADVELFENEINFLQIFHIRFELKNSLLSNLI